MFPTKFFSTVYHLFTNNCCPMKHLFLLRTLLFFGLVAPPPFLELWHIEKGILLGTSKVNAQTVGMVVDWDHHDSPSFRSSGVDVRWNTETLSYENVPTSTTSNATPEDQGGDWYYDLTEVKDQSGAPIGTIAVGYLGWSNWGFIQAPCLDRTPETSNFPTFLSLPPDRIPGDKRQGVAFYNTAGELQWMRAYHAGTLLGVIQDSDGNIVVTGFAFNSDANLFADMASAPPLRYNPTSANDAALSCGGASASERKMMLMKLDLNGDIQWNHVFAELDAASALGQFSSGWSVVETGANGNGGYRIVGNISHNGVRPFIVQTDPEGLLVWKHVWSTQGAYWDGLTPNSLAALAIAYHADGNGNAHFLVTGYRDAGPQWAPFIAYFAESGPTSSFTEPIWVRDLLVDQAQFPGIVNPGTHLSHDVCFVQQQGILTAAWPVIANRTISSTANAFVYTLPVNSPSAVSASVDLGEIHAFDLYIGVAPMSNGNLAVVTTKWPEGSSVSGDPYGWDDMPLEVQECLIAHRSTPATYWNPTNPAGPGNVYRFYGSQSYAAELDVDDLSIIWDHQWIHNGGYEELPEGTDCYLGNPRRRQCNFKVVQASDGGLLVCGNTGHNFDDAYIAKLVPCELLFPTADLPLDGNGQHVLAASATWTTDRNVIGTVIVPDGMTLTIDGATIGFATSTPEQTTNITVQPGGTLDLINGAHLTTWQGCPAPTPGMWDGVKVLSSFDPEGPPQQTWPGQVRMESGARIQNALVGVLCGEGDPANPGYVNSTPGTYGGVIETTDAVFENNRFDVVATQWVGNTGTPSSSLVPEPCQARLRFVNTTFTTTAPLLNADLYPVAHLRVADNQPFVHGCTFANELPTHTSSLEMGHGIDALNANLRVGPCLSGPCLPGSDQGNTFRNLDHAIHAVATEGAPYSTIRDNTFTNNICGLYLKDLPGVDVRGNQLQMGAWDLGTGSYTNPDEEFWEGHHRAIFATGSNAFSIQDNSITRSPGNTTPCEGIVVGYTGAENEVVFRNNATDLDRAYVGEGESADVNGDPNLAGLQFQCNTNMDNAVNFTSRKANGDQLNETRHTIRGRQGTPTYSASNSFNGALHFEVSTSADALVYVEYSHTSGQVPATYTVQDPFNLDADYLQPVLVNASLNCATDPPVWITGGSGTFTSVKPLLTSGKTEYGNLRYQYEQLIDGGNTDEVVQEIVDAWPQEILIYGPVCWPAAPT